MTGNQANVQRILNCRAPSTVPVTYADDAERRRVVKYEAAAEMQESPAPSAIYRDCSTNNGCRTATDITLNGHSYYASYGCTQFVTETFLRHLKNLMPALSGDQLASLRLNTAVRLPNGKTGTMADMVRLAYRRAEAAGNAFRDVRNSFGKTGMTTVQATAAWNSLSPAERSKFMRRTGFGLTEFIDMLAFGKTSDRAQTGGEALNAFGSEAAWRTVDGNGATTFGDWLRWLYKSQDPYNFVSQYVQAYADEFMGTASRGDWRSLRCSDHLEDTPSVNSSFSGSASNSAFRRPPKLRKVLVVWPFMPSPSG